MTGLLGPNAAGKTTLVKVLATLIRLDGGTATVAGHDLSSGSAALRRSVGLVLHRSLLYPNLSVQQNLTHYACLYGVPDRDERVRGLLSRVGLWRRRHDQVRTLSRGLVQRLAIARAVIHDPPVLLLDEPHSGLDQSAAAELDELIAAVADRGRTVLLATHDLRRVAELTDRVILLRRGQLVWSGETSGLPAAHIDGLFSASASAHRASGCRRSGAGRSRMPDRADPAGDRTVAGPGVLRSAAIVARKDLLLELSSREIVPAVAVFGALVVVLLHLALPIDRGSSVFAAPGILWVGLLFGSTLGLARAMAAELESGGMTGLLVSPIDRGALFLGKWLAGYVLASLVAAFLLLAATILFALPHSNLPAAAAVLALGLLGWVAAGMLMSAAAAGTRAREVLLPVLLFPVVVPLLSPSIEAMALALAGAPLGEATGLLALITAYDAVFLVLGFLLFTHVVES